MGLNAIISLLGLSLVQITAVPRERLAQNDVDLIRKVYYTNLCALTNELSKNLARTILENMEKTITTKSRGLPFIHELNLTEKQRLNSQVTQLQTFIPRIQAAIAVEKSIGDRQFLNDLYLFEYQVMNIKAALRHFMKKLNYSVVKKARRMAKPKKNSTRLETLTMLQDLRSTIVNMNYHLDKERKKLNSVKH